MRHIAGEQIPANGRGKRNAEHHRHENPGHRVRELLDGRLVALRFGDHAHDLRQHSILADFRGAHLERARQIDGRAEYLVTGRFRDRHAFPGQHRLIDAGAALRDGAIHRDFLSGPHQQDVAGLHLLDRNVALRTALDETRGLGAEFHQLADGFAGLAPAAGLKITPKQNERRDHGPGFKIKMVAANPHAPQAVEKRRQRAERDERVHIRGKISRLGHHAAVEIETEAQNDDAAENGLKPDAEISSEIRPRQLNIPHRQDHHGDPKGDRPERSLSGGLDLLLRQLTGIGRFVIGQDFIAIVDHGPTERRLCHGRLVERDAGAAGAQVDVGFEHARHFAQGALVADRASGAVHAADGESCCGRHSGLLSARVWDDAK